jgi:hypothetical protein
LGPAPHSPSPKPHQIKANPNIPAKIPQIENVEAILEISALLVPVWADPIAEVKSPMIPGLVLVDVMVDASVVVMIPEVVVVTVVVVVELPLPIPGSIYVQISIKFFWQQGRSPNWKLSWP